MFDFSKETKILRQALLSTWMIFFLFGCGGETAEPLSRPWTVSLSHPESILPAGRTLYVSDIGVAMEPGAKDGDGKIWKVSATGESSPMILLPLPGEEPLDAPKGLALSGSRLYTADIDKIRGFDLATGKGVFTADLSSTGTGFLNDLLFLPGGTLLVSSTDLGKVFAVDTRSGAFRETSLRNLNGVNGLSLDPEGEWLYFVTLGGEGPADGGVYRVRIDDCNLLHDSPPEGCHVEDLKASPGRYDGVAALSAGRVLAGDWGEFAPEKGRLYLYESENGWKPLKGTEGLSGPADFSSDGVNLYYPELLTGKVHGRSIEEDPGSRR